ncbi:MAG: hypothetical protein HY876_07145 [Coriobacteriales bacterium]|nr:hypothetical protein [Coriobacteriales bacterium]
MQGSSGGTHEFGGRCGSWIEKAMLVLLLLALSGAVGCTSKAEVTAQPEAVEAPAPEQAKDPLGLSPARELWRVSGYVPADPVYDVQILGQPHEPLDASAADAYFSDDGTKVLTAYPAVLDGTDGSVVWEGKEAPAGELALSGDGIYVIDPVRRLWPSAKSFASADAALKGSQPHEYQDRVIQQDEAEAPAVVKVRPTEDWEVTGVRSDPTGRYQLFYERPLVTKPGTREAESGRWEWMVFDTKAGDVAYVRSADEVGFQVLSAPAPGEGDVTPGQTDSDLGRIKVFADGSFIAGNKFVSADPSKDRDILPPGGASVRGVGLVEGRPTMVVLLVEAEPEGPMDSTGESTRILYDAEFDERFPLPADCGVESASRDGLTVLCEPTEGERGIVAWRLEPSGL